MYGLTKDIDLSFLFSCKKEEAPNGLLFRSTLLLSILFALVI